jgi:sugar phosphate isomerase/epimerase
VRPTGLIDPTRVDVKLNLPRMVEGIRSTGAICDQITTNIETADKPIGAFNGRQVMPAEVLSVAGALGIGLYRWGGFTYEAGAATPFGDQVPAQLKAFSRKLASLAALNRKTRTTALYHTYSGGNNARSVWDLMAILAPYSANELAINFDIGHMTREGALSAWSTNLRYAMPRVKGLGLKDGSVTRTVDGNIVGAFPQAGAGLVRWVEFFKLLREGGFSGPGGAQYEYDVIGVKGAPAALSTTFWADHPQFQSGNLTAPFMTAEMKKDLSYYRAHAVMAGWREDELS